MKKLLVTLLGVFYFQGILACVCPDSLTHTQYHENADLIIQGIAVRVTTNWMSGGWKYTFKVSQSWKRSTDQVLFINSPWEKDCGFIFKEGLEYLVYINKGFTMKTFQCSGNVLLSEADTQLVSLGKGITPKRSPQVAYMYWTVSILAALGLIFIGFVVLKKRKS